MTWKEQGQRNVGEVVANYSSLLSKKGSDEKIK